MDFKEKDESKEIYKLVDGGLYYNEIDWFTKVSLYQTDFNG